jgi:hypothetical protein
VLSSALNDAAENDFVLRNVMQSKSPPKVPDEEMVIVRDVPAFVAEVKTSGRKLYVPAWCRCSPACAATKCWR